MPFRAESLCTVVSFDERPLPGGEGEGGKNITTGHMTVTYTGDLAGESRAEMLLIGHAESDGVLVGFERITGVLGGRTGSFVLEFRNTFDTTGATSTYHVVPGSGRGELRGLRGEGVIHASGQGPQPFALDYDFGDA